MTMYADPPVDSATPMTTYEGQVWDTLNEHWQRRNNRRGLPNWASAALGRTGEVSGNAVRRVKDAVPEAVAKPIRRAGDAVADTAMRPALAGAAALLEMVNDWAMELNNPKHVEELARKNGLDIGEFSELRQQDLQVCDRLLTRNTLKWRTAYAFEGGAMGLLAMVPVAGIPAALTADILVIQVLSTSIAARVAYSYGYDAKDPKEQEFIERLVQRSFMAQAAKAKPLRDAARAAEAVKGRVNWSQKLRQDHRLLASLEKLMQQLGPAGLQGARQERRQGRAVRGCPRRCRHERGGPRKSGDRRPAVLPDPVPVRQVRAAAAAWLWRPTWTTPVPTPCSERPAARRGGRASFGRIPGRGAANRRGGGEHSPAPIDPLTVRHRPFSDSCFSGVRAHARGGVPRHRREDAHEHHHSGRDPRGRTACGGPRVRLLYGEARRVER